MLFFELFWYFAGLWNMAIATVGWQTLTHHDKVTGSAGTRIAVFLFGVGYAAVGFACVSCWWIIAVGAVLKLRLAFQHFKENKRLGRDVNPMLSKILIGDALWAAAFIGWLVRFGIYGMCR